MLIKTFTDSRTLRRPLRLIANFSHKSSHGSQNIGKQTKMKIRSPHDPPLRAHGCPKTEGHTSKIPRPATLCVLYKNVSINVRETKKTI